MSNMQGLSASDKINSKEASSELLARLFRVIHSVGRPCIICSKVPLKHSEVAYLLSLPLVESIILESEDRELLTLFSDRLGFHIENGSDWKLPSKVPAEMIYVGRWTDFGARVAWLAWRIGIRRIHSVSAFQFYKSYGAIQTAVYKSLRSILFRLWQSPLRRKVTEKTGFAFELEQYLFSRRLRAIDNLSLPITNAAFVWQPGKIIIVGGTLGPGGAERQLINTLLGIFAGGNRDVHFLHHAPMSKPNDFFLPHLTKAGASFSQVDEIDHPSLLPCGLETELEQCLAPLGDLGAEITAYAKQFLVRRPEIVHAWLDQLNVVAGLAAVLVGVPRVVLSCRSLSPVHFKFIQPYMRPIYRLLAKFPNVIFLNNSQAGALDYKQWLDIESLKIQVIPNGFDFSTQPPPEELASLRSKYRGRLGIPVDAPVVGVVMRISEEKHPLLWIEIARLVAHEIPKVHFMMIGDGPMRDKVQKTAQEKLKEKCHFPGHERDIAMAIGAMDVFLLTSRIEGLPNVLIEAQALGVVPVAINVGGVAETLVDGVTGFLVKTSDPAACAKKIIELINNKETYRRASTKASEFVRSRFSRDRMIEQTLRVYG